MTNPIHDFIKGIQNFFHSGVHDVLAGLSALAHSIQRNGGDVLIAAAAAAVMAAEASDGTGKEKFEAAYAAVAATLAAKGLPVVTNAINGALEAAVAQHKEELAKA